MSVNVTIQEQVYVNSIVFDAHVATKVLEAVDKITKQLDALGIDPRSGSISASDSAGGGSVYITWDLSSS